MYECCICNQHGRRTLSGILRHIREVHPHFNGKVTCGVNGCPRTSSSYEGLRQHMYRYHRDVLNVPATVPEASSSQQEQEEEEEDGYTVEDMQIEPDFNPSYESTTAIAAKYILKTRDGRKLTQLCTDGIIQDSKIFVQNTVDILKKKLISAIEGSGATDTTIAEVHSILDDETLRNPFAHLDTQYKQEKFIKENFNYVVSIYNPLSADAAKCRLFLYRHQWKEC